jgi:cell division septation protein DedD
MSAEARTCAACGRPLAPGAKFCRGCGARVLAEERPRRPRRRARALALVCLGAALGGAIAATALVLAGGSSDSSGGLAATDAGAHSVATVPETTEATTSTGNASSPTSGTNASAQAVGTIESGSYMQAGSFRTVAGAEAELQRLEAVGIQVYVADSDQAEELYPGFQVLLAGPLSGSAERKSLLKRLHGNGVPSAFARPLTPAHAISGPEAAAGNWSGTLEVSGLGRPHQEGPLQARLSMDADGRGGQLEFTERNCAVELSLLAATDVTVSYAQDRGCVGAGDWAVRPEGESMALTLLPPNSEAIVLGRLAAE